jgi:NACalpha-BTF3-like transcription factor
MDNERLQKIDEIVNRTNVSYEKAKNALDEANGDVLEAVIILQNSNKSFNSNDAKQKGEQILEEIKKILKKGNATKLIIKKNNETVVNLPITAGLLGAFIAPFLTAAGVTAALLTQCSVEIIQSDGNVIDVNQKVEDSINVVKSTVDDVKEKVQDGAEDIKDTFNDM